MARMILNDTVSNDSSRFWARAHGIHFSAGSVARVMEMIDQFEEERDLRAASYIVNDALAA